jgi:hypothetical protein
VEGEGGEASGETSDEAASEEAALRELRERAMGELAALVRGLKRHLDGLFASRRQENLVGLSPGVAAAEDGASALACLLREHKGGLVCLSTQLNLPVEIVRAALEEAAH